jgi:hypothetical protein
MKEALVILVVIIAGALTGVALYVAFAPPEWEEQYYREYEQKVLLDHYHKTKGQQF